MSNYFKFDYDDQIHIISVTLKSGVSPSDLKEFVSKSRQIISQLVMQGIRASVIVDMSVWTPNPDKKKSEENIEIAKVVCDNLMNTSKVVEYVAYIIKDVTHLEVINECHIRSRTCDRILYFSKLENAHAWIQRRRDKEKEN